ncbi:hypothetical protein FGB62_110g18 [Gracilaria domingensis]|nr:hypothetical protein FGB62_110g18 [Gracilaria domingensis]
MENDGSGKPNHGFGGARIDAGTKEGLLLGSDVNAGHEQGLPKNDRFGHSMGMGRGVDGCACGGRLVPWGGRGGVGGANFAISRRGTRDMTRRVAARREGCEGFGARSSGRASVWVSSAEEVVMLGGGVKTFRLGLETSRRVKSPFEKAGVDSRWLQKKWRRGELTRPARKL